MGKERCNIITLYGTLILVDDDYAELVQLTPVHRTTTPFFVCGWKIEYTHSPIDANFGTQFQTYTVKNEVKK
jgi:hypothetical protein